MRITQAMKQKICPIVHAVMTTVPQLPTATAQNLLAAGERTVDLLVLLLQTHTALLGHWVFVAI